MWKKSALVSLLTSAMLPTALLAGEGKRFAVPFEGNPKSPVLREKVAVSEGEFSK